MRDSSRSPCRLATVSAGAAHLEFLRRPAASPPLRGCVPPAALDDSLFASAISLQPCAVTVRVDSVAPMSQYPIGVYGGGELLAQLRHSVPAYTFVDGE